MNNDGKFLIKCVMHEEKSPSMLVDINSDSYQCFGCGYHGIIKENKLVHNEVLKHIYHIDDIHIGTFKEQLMERCCDSYPIQIVLNSGMIIECGTDDIVFYDDHFQIEQVNNAAVIYPSNIKSKFYPRQIWVLYSSISFLTDSQS